MAKKSSDQRSAVHQGFLDRIMPRHAPFYAGLVAGAVAFAASFPFYPKFALPIAANAMFIAYLALSLIKLPELTAAYLRKHAREEDTPSGGIFFLVVVVVATSVVSLFMALSQEKPGVPEVALGVGSVLLGWFTVHAVGAFHYAYEYYQVSEVSGSKGEPAGGLIFAGDDEPDGTAFMYFSYTVGTSVATSDTKIGSNAMRRRVGVHLVFSHLYNTLILAAAVNVVLSLGGGGGGG